MALVQKLQDLANRLGLVRVVSEKTDDERPNHKIATRTISLEALTARIRSEEVRTLAEQPAEMSVPFEEVYAKAGIDAPANGWTIRKLAAFVRSGPRSKMDRDEIQEAIVAALTEDGATVEQVVEDAVARDEALDAFESFVRRKLDDRIAIRSGRATHLESEIRSLQEEIARLREHDRTEEEQWRTWQKRKRTEEDILAWALGFLLEEPLIDRDDEDDEDDDD